MTREEVIFKSESEQEFVDNLYEYCKNDKAIFDFVNLKVNDSHLEHWIKWFVFPSFWKNKKFDLNYIYPKLIFRIYTERDKKMQRIDKSKNLCQFQTANDKTNDN